MNGTRKSTFRPATERKIPFEELIKSAEQRKEQQIMNSEKQKMKEKEQVVI